MRSKTVWALVALNILLLASLCLRSLTPAAHAQAAARPSDYLMITGEIVGVNTGVVYILDTRANALSMRTIDPNNHGLIDAPPIDLTRIFRQAR